MSRQYLSRKQAGTATRPKPVRKQSLPQVMRRLDRLTPESVLTLQQTVGNRATSRLIQRRLMAFNTFVTRKNQAAEKKGWLFKVNRSVKDVKKIYAAYNQAVQGQNWDLAHQQLDKLEAKIGRMRAKDYWKTTQLRDALLDEMTTGLEEERNWVDDQKFNPLRNQLNDVLPANQRPGVKLYMKQGLVGHLGQMKIFSGQFSSCSPIIFFNATTKVGGLYHFPGGASDPSHEGSAEQISNLEAMHKQVRPTVIYVGEGANFMEDEDSDDPLAKMNAMTQGTSDQPTLMEFFDDIKKAGTQVRSHPAGSSATITLGGGGNIQITSGQPDINSDLRHNAMLNAPPSTWFVGEGDVEDWWL